MILMMCIYYGQIGMHTNKHVSKIFKGRFFLPQNGWQSGTNTWEHYQLQHAQTTLSASTAWWIYDYPTFPKGFLPNYQFQAGLPLHSMTSCLCFSWKVIERPTRTLDVDPCALKEILLVDSWIVMTSPLKWWWKATKSPTVDLHLVSLMPYFSPWLSITCCMVHQC